MKVIAVLVATLSLASAFAPQSGSRASTSLDALFDEVRYREYVK